MEHLTNELIKNKQINNNWQLFFDSSNWQLYVFSNSFLLYLAKFSVTRYYIVRWLSPGI